MTETLSDIIYNYVGSAFHETHYPEGGVDQTKVEEKINSLTNVEFLELISNALQEKR